MPQDSITTRRSVLAGGAAALAGLAGCLGGNQVQKSEPDQDGEGTLGELRWILEETHGMSVTSMTYSDEVVDLEYESQASDSAESRDEIGQVISSYGLIIESDGPSARHRRPVREPGRGVPRRGDVGRAVACGRDVRRPRRPARVQHAPFSRIRDRVRGPDDADCVRGCAGFPTGTPNLGGRPTRCRSLRANDGAVAVRRQRLRCVRRRLRYDSGALQSCR